MKFKLPDRPALAVFFRVAFAFALLNAPFWWLAQSNLLHRAWFNVDLLVPLVLAPLSLLAAAASLLLLWCLDMAVSQSLTWHFHSPFEFLRSIEFLPAIHLAGYVSVSHALLLIPFVACALAAARLVRRTPRTLRAAALIFLAVAAADALNGTSSFGFSARRVLPGNTAGSATLVSARSMLAPASQELRELGPGASLTTKFGVLAWAKAHPDRSVVLVLVESMGLHDDAGLRQWSREQLADEALSARFDITELSVPFFGSTVSAELRELCQIDGSYRNLESRHAQGCLPHAFSALGWENIGLHGFSHRMFMRSEWWATIGLEHRLFGEELSAPDQALCGGAFVGICDADVMRRAVHEAAAGRRFVYAVTLNSHLPMPQANATATLDALCKRAGTGDNVCGLTAVIGVGLQALREALKQSARLPLVLVVGDHAPPFSDLMSRRQYSQTLVPGFVLVPKD